MTGELCIPLGIYQSEKYFNVLATCNATYGRTYTNTFSMQLHQRKNSHPFGCKAEISNCILVNKIPRLLKKPINIKFSRFPAGDLPRCSHI